MDMMLVSAALGRILVGFYFAFFGVWNVCHWTPTLAFMLQKKLPFARVLLGVGILVQSIMGLMLMFGFYANIAAFILIPFDIVSIFIFHAFWNFNGEIRRLNMIIFIANITATLGALLLLIR